MNGNVVRSSYHSFASTSGHPGGRTPLILVVEDDADIRIMIEQMLELRGYCVTGVRDGAEAITAIQRNPRISFLLTDIRMPGISGWELAHRAVEIRPMKVMYITGWSGQEIPGGAPHGPLLLKPWGASEFYRCVERLIGAP
jgi:CheY-like chemotaxis protein